MLPAKKMKQREQTQIINKLRRQHGEGFVAKVMLASNRNTVIGDEWVNWGSLDVVRAIYNYMKQLFQSFTAYTAKITWQDVMQFTGPDGMPVFRLLELIEQLGELVSTSAQEVACQFIATSVEMFRYLFGLVDNSESISFTDAKSMSNVESLSAEISNCGAYIERLGEKGLEFIQWIARKIRGAISYVSDSVFKIFAWLGGSVSAVADNGYYGAVKATKSIGKAALRVGVFTVALAGEIGDEAFRILPGAKKKLDTLGRLLTENIGSFFQAMFASIKKNSLLSEMISTIMRTAGLLNDFAGGDSQFVKAIRTFGSFTRYTLDLVGKALSWIMWLRRLPNLAVERVVSVFVRPLIEPVSRFLSKKLSENPDDELSKLNDAVSAAENIYANNVRTGFLRQTIDEAKQVQARYEEKLKERDSSVGWTERVSSAWSLSAALVEVIDGRDLNAKQSNAVQRILGPATSMFNETALMTPKLQAATAAAVLKPEHSVTSLEEDTVFAEMFRKTRADIRGTTTPTPLQVNELRQAWARQRSLTMDAYSKLNPPPRQNDIDKQEEFFDRIISSLDEISPEALAIQEAKQKAWSKFKILLLGLGLLGIYFIWSQNSAANKEKKAMDAERRLEFDRDITARGDTAISDDLAIRLTGDSITTAKLASDIDSEITRGLSEMSGEQTRDFFVLQSSNLKTSANVEVRRQTNLFLDAARKRGDIEEIVVIQEKGWVYNTKRTEIVLSDEARSAKATEVDVANMKHILSKQVQYDLSTRRTIYRSWEQDKYGESILDTAVSGVASLFFVDTSSFTGLFSQMITAMTGSEYHLAAALFAAYAWILIPLVAVLLFLAVALAALELYEGAGLKEVSLRLTQHIALLTSVIKLFDGVVTLVYFTLNDKAAMAATKWSELADGYSGGLGQLAKAASTVMNFLNPYWWLSAVWSAASGTVAFVTSMFKTKDTNTPFEQQKKCLDAFDISKLVISHAPVETNLKKMPQAASVACSFCPEFISSKCADCDTPYCSEECADFDWPAHQMSCA